MRRVLILIVRASILTAAFVLVGVAFNALRSDGIDLVARSEYQIYVPCPESQADAGSVTAETAQKQQVLYVDARPVEAYEREHIQGAISFPYPLLGDPPAEKVDSLKQRGVPIVTYGGGGRDQTGEMMADLLTELGVEEVTHLEGGLATWREQGGEVEGEAGGNDDE